MNLSDREIEETYSMLVEAHRRHLRQHGVKLPKLKNAAGDYVKDALALVYLAFGYPETRVVTKTELTEFIRQYYPEVNDVQQARHLGAQRGWWVLAGGRDNVVANLQHGEHKLHCLESPYPGFSAQRRVGGEGFDALKEYYNFRCATCGSREGESHFHWPGTRTKLQKAHKDPARELSSNNMIPQCQKCNRSARGWWVYDGKGRVHAVAHAGIIRRSSEAVRREIFQALKEEFETET